ncbi:ABC transporter ATP-binding protein [Rhodococcus sp. BP-149]|uniref:ABC transporter ATP-binding protein n=1 Tax=unclassified Rhodococcus (in: high G+C Gram-positive bacteria) TaxID=192944 RepID=UPI001C9AFFFC|nr:MULTISPECIES: ABC transporter ATP-binding protein [unclassified Rhodococcus (in: high G+C Gram-positive bacteria)]MBY6687768.1 ABC transporter ATP-binding protein [Rhodococcus sp. BP-288]MBY6696033.1 ABC transporter ATP-binding protein [Rhodococcus sp. BP-188]MBY6700630.1 ABC transporter ATP-binding protein [Rhodococcus sp. BP-285]MBY6705027.1 ABC transporter ATP-binding protein [Rhodococcus sp. BP-283]MBY6713755.1 ABC transporter ATP-binding protein [Rhodococcus sp. BP-160]
MTTEPLLDVRNLRAYIGTARGEVRAVDDVTFSLGEAESLGVVGESGSGKSVMAKAIMGLMPPRSGRTGDVTFRGRDLLSLSKKEKLEVWGNQISMVFQDPGRSLNPVVRVERQLTEGMRRHLGLSRSAARSRALELLEEVGVPDPERRLRNYPHEMSGGMRQRVMIAIALACEPDLLIADEPTTALDVTIQRQILDLLRRIRRDRGTAIMLISHDLAVVAGQTDRVAVMYAGRMAEVGSTREVFEAPRHRYTHALLGATPTIDHPRHAPLRLIDGSLPDPVNPPSGCRFSPRCSAAVAECSVPGPVFESVGTDHHVACLELVGRAITGEDRHGR